MLGESEYFAGSEPVIKNIEKSYIKDLIREARSESLPVIKNDRNQFSAAISCIIDYTKKQAGIFVSDIYTLCDRLDDPVYVFNNTITIYGDYPFKHANNLANELYKLGEDLSYLTRFRTVIYQEEFWIDYASRPLCHIMSLTSYVLGNEKRWNYTRALEPYYINDVPYLPPEIEIIDVYNKLNNLQDYAEFEECLFNKSKTRAGIETANSGIEAVKGSGAFTGKTCREKKRDLLDLIKISVIQDWLPKQRDTILIGSWAYDVMSNICINPDRIQIISLRHIDQIKTSLSLHIRKIVQDIHINNTDSYELHLPKEYRTQRTILSLTIPSKTGLTEKPFLEFFNAADYDIIPCYLIKHTNIANKFLLLRFLFIELWNLKILQTFNQIDTHYYNIKVKKIWDLIVKIRAIDYPYKTIIGRYEEYEISRKNLIGELKNTSHKFYPVFPKLVEKKNGALKYL